MMTPTDALRVDKHLGYNIIHIHVPSPRVTGMSTIMMLPVLLLVVQPAKWTVDWHEGEGTKCHSLAIQASTGKRYTQDLKLP